MVCIHTHPVRLVSLLQPLQYFPLTQLQLQPPATSQATVFFSHTTPAPASSSNLPNGVIVEFHHLHIYYEYLFRPVS